MSARFLTVAVDSTWLVAWVEAWGVEAAGIEALLATTLLATSWALEVTGVTRSLLLWEEFLREGVPISKEKIGVLPEFLADISRLMQQLELKITRYS